MQSRDYSTVINLGVDSDSSKDLLFRLEPEVKARTNDKEVVIVIDIGTNDAMLENSIPVTDVREFTDNITELYKIASKYTSKVIFIGIKPCMDQLTNPVTWGDYRYTNERLWQFEFALREVCEKNNIPIVKLFEKIQEELKSSNILQDGLHPNDEGHRFIASIVQLEIDKLVGVRV